MKTTLEIPDPILRRAKARAAEQGIPLRQFVSEAVEERLNAGDSETEKPWMKHFGGLRHMKSDIERMQRIIDEEFGQIEPEDWK